MKKSLLSLSLLSLLATGAIAQTIIPLANFTGEAIGFNPEGTAVSGYRDGATGPQARVWGYGVFGGQVYRLGNARTANETSIAHAVADVPLFAPIFFGAQWLGIDAGSGAVWTSGIFNIARTPTKTTYPVPGDFRGWATDNLVYGTANGELYVGDGAYPSIFGDASLPGTFYGGEFNGGFLAGELSVGISRAIVFELATSVALAFDGEPDALNAVARDVAKLEPPFPGLWAANVNTDVGPRLWVSGNDGFSTVTVKLPELPGATLQDGWYYLTTSISADGSIIVGYAENPVTGVRFALLWNVAVFDNVYEVSAPNIIGTPTYTPEGVVNGISDGLTRANDVIIQGGKVIISGKDINGFPALAVY